MKIKSSVKCTSSMKTFLNKLKALDGKAVGAGYDDKIHRASGMPIAQLALIHEMGIGVVQRPFMSQAFTEVRGINDTYAPKAIKSILYDNAPMETTLKQQLGNPIRDAITYTIDMGMFPVTNNPTPLIDTGELRRRPKVFFWKDGY